ncbi:MAG: hypothetical protein ACK56V_15320, partial [Bacteroidota bacterium]
MKINSTFLNIVFVISLFFVLPAMATVDQDTTIVSAVSSGGSLENTGNGSIEFSFGQLLYANEIA